MKRLLFGLLAYGLAIGPAAAASTTFTLATGIGAGTLSYQGWLCSAIICTGSVPENSSGLELFTSGNPGNISASTLPLPSGASTAANQSTIITGINSPVPPQVNHGENIGGVEGLAAGGAAVAGYPVLIGGSDGTDARTAVTDSSGHLVVNCNSGCTSTGGTSLADQTAFTQGTTSITPIGCLDITSYSGLTSGHAGVVQCDSSGRPIVVGAGTAGSAAGGVVSVQGVSSGTNLPVSQATASALNATVVGSGSAGSAASGVVTVQGIASMTPVQVSQATASNLNATVTGSGSAGSAASGVITVQGISSMTPVQVTPQVQTTGGVTPKILNALSNSAVSVKSSGGQLYGLQCGNTNASEEYIQIYNITSGSVTVGTSSPTLSIPIAATSTGGLMISLVGIQFGTAITVAATTTATGGSAPSTALDCNAFYN